MENVELKVFYAKNENPSYKGKRKFLYVTMSEEAGAKVTTNRTMVIKSNTSDEVHLTTDGAFEAYLAKRLCIPKLVKILNTQKEVNQIVEDMGYAL